MFSFLEKKVVSQFYDIHFNILMFQLSLLTQFHSKFPIYFSIKWVWKLCLQIYSCISQGPISKIKHVFQSWFSNINLSLPYMDMISLEISWPLSGLYSDFSHLDMIYGCFILFIFIFLWSLIWFLCDDLMAISIIATKIRLDIKVLQKFMIKQSLIRQLITRYRSIRSTWITLFLKVNVLFVYI